MEKEVRLNILSSVTNIANHIHSTLHSAYVAGVHYYYESRARKAEEEAKVFSQVAEELRAEASRLRILLILSRQSSRAE